jgi:signal transduction histidine kinase
MTERDPLARVEQAAIAEEVASLLRHDLRNRLVVLSGAASYLRRKVAGTPLWGADARVPRFFEVIDEEIEASSSLVAERLTVDRFFARTVGRVDATEPIRRAVACARIAPARLRCVEIDLPGDAIPIEADAMEVSLAVRCLVENAAEAAEGGAIRVRGLVDGAELTIEVSDAGPGIPEEQVEAVMSPFFTTKEGHVGLGLCIAQHVARRLHGRLAIQPGAVGARVTLALPLFTGGADHGKDPPLG